MEWLVFFGAIIWAVMKAAEKKKAQQEKQSGRTATVRQQNNPQQRPAAQRSGSINRPGAPGYAPQGANQRPASAQMSQQMSQAPVARHEAPPTSRSAEPPVSQIKSQLTEIKRSERHELEAMSRHGHEETSMSGFADAECLDQPGMQTAAAPETAAPAACGDLRFDGRAVVAGILYAEILGKPKALRHES